MASYTTGRTITVQRGVRFTVEIGTQNGLVRQVEGGFQSPSAIPGVVRLYETNSGALLNVTGTGELVYTQTFTETCDVTGSAITYTWALSSSSRSISGISNSASARANLTAIGLPVMPITRVEAFCPSLPSGVLYEYVSGVCSASVSFEWVFDVAGGAITIPYYGLTAAGSTGSASESSCSAVGIIGQPITARLSRFRNLIVSGSPGTYSITSDVGQAFAPPYNIDLNINHKYSDGGSIAPIEFALLTPSTVPVVFNQPGGSTAGSIPESDTSGRLLSTGNDSMYVQVFNGTESTSSNNANLNGSYGSGSHWFKYSFPQSLVAAGASSFTYGGSRVNATAFDPGIDLYTGIPDLDSGYTALLASVDTKTITGSWVASGSGGNTLTFTPSASYQVCGYRWLLVTFSNISGGGTATIGTSTQTVPAGGSVTLVVDRFGDAACLLDPPASLGSPQINATKTGTVTGGTVVGTHTAPAGYGTTSGAAVYFSRTDAVPSGVANEGKPHTLGMLCLFSGGCPGLRLNNMTLSTLLAFFTSNLATGMTITLASGSLTPTAGTREAAHLANSMGMSCLNSGLPFFETLNSSGTVKKLVANYLTLNFPPYGGDVIGGSLGSPQTVSVTFNRVCPIAYFYTLLDGKESAYTVTVRNNPGLTGSAVNLTGSMAPDSFSFMIQGDEVAKSKAIGTSTLQVNVVESDEIQQLITGTHSGGFYPPGAS